jgi:CHAD domain-containing protein
VRAPLGDEVYRGEDQTCRQVGARLSGLRDAAVLVATLERVVERAGPRAPRSRFARVHAWLSGRRDAAYEQVAGQAQALEEVQAQLRGLLARVAAWPLAGADWPALEPGLRRVYASGARQFAQACALPVEETFHEWRKQAKYLWYHAQLLHEVWPPLMEAWADQLDLLGETLGQEHDLAVLRGRVLAEFPRAGVTATIRALEARVTEQRAGLQAVARWLGQRVYAERPGAFARRLGGYWQAWRQEQ